MSVVPHAGAWIDSPRSPTPDDDGSRISAFSRNLFQTHPSALSQASQRVQKGAHDVRPFDATKRCGLCCRGGRMNENVLLSDHPTTGRDRTTISPDASHS